VKVFAISNRGWDIRSVRRGPEQMRSGDIAATARTKSKHWSHARWRVNDVVENYRRRDDAMRGIVVRVQPVRTPEFFAGDRIATRNTTSAGNNYLHGLPVA